jgi:hypothetical protein
MGKETPKAPDYAKAAEEQAQGSREAINMQNWANRPGQYTPFGNQTWESSAQIDPATGQRVTAWNQYTTLAPEAQRALDAQLGLQAGRSELGASLMPRAEQEFGSKMDWSQFGGPGGRVDPYTLDAAEKYRKGAEEAIYGQWSSRAMPEQARSEEALRTRLANQGFSEGDEGYDYALQKMREQQADAQRQAQYQATIGAGGEAQRMLGMEAQAGAQNFGQRMQASQYDTQRRQQEIAEAMQQRGFSLNEINALLTGQQVGMPSMPGFNTSAAAQGPQYMQAAQLTGQADLDRFNASQAGWQGLLGGAGSLAQGAGMMGWTPFG